jgi:hypothetical protein
MPNSNSTKVLFCIASIKMKFHKFFFLSFFLFIIIEIAAKDEELKRFLQSIVKVLAHCESCELKIDNGAHSAVGKIITKLCYMEKTRKEKNSGDGQRQSEGYQKLQMNEEIEDDVNTGEEISDRLSPFERPFRREYLLRSNTSRPAPYSRQSPQRMYCLLSDDGEFRLAGAFTEDTMFF